MESTARGLVQDRLPDEVHAQLQELDTHARRAGRLPVAAAGTLLGGSVDHVRHSVLQILLRAGGWPTQYPQARFCFWLREQGLLAGVRGAVEAAGKVWLHELNNLYVSPVIAEALIAADRSFASDVKAARQLLTRQFPPLATDISTEQFIQAARSALSEGGELPHTIIVLDEVQQYISEAQDRSAAITEVAEAVQTQFDSRVMLVGAGQSALSAGTQALMWLRDRFRIAIELTDADVEAVTRKVLLRKRPTAKPAIEQMFEAHAGEVARHLQSTRVGPRAEDMNNRVADYPLLSTRRRFWEACFQAVDAAGMQSQLRSQLRILHDSLQNVAERPLGAVIPAGDLFNALAPSLVTTGVLLNEISTRIQKLDDGSDEGHLQHELCGVVFLIGKLPRQKGIDLGVRANATTLADLLIDDITTDSGPVRHRIAGTLELLADDGVLMKVGDEYRLQTTEGAEWDRAFRERQRAVKEVDIATRRDQLFLQAVQELLSDIKPVQGEYKLRRKLALNTGGNRRRETSKWSASGFGTAGRARAGMSTRRRAGWAPKILRSTCICRRRAPNCCGLALSMSRRRARCSTSTGSPPLPKGAKRGRAWRAGAPTRRTSETPSCGTCCAPRRSFRAVAASYSARRSLRRSGQASTHPSPASFHDSVMATIGGGRPR